MVRSAGCAGGDFSFDAEYARGAGGEKLHQAHQRNFPGVHEFAERERERGFKAGDAEGRAIEFHVFAGGMMRRVVGGDGVHAAVGDAGDQRVAIFA